jgi:hypothetical protein
MRKIKIRVKAFILGVTEFRSDLTTHLAAFSLEEAYDRGREFAHVVTLRRYDSAR